MLQSDKPIKLSESKPFAPGEAQSKWGVHSCKHADFEHICGCDVKQDHPALNP